MIFNPNMKKTINKGFIFKKKFFVLIFFLSFLCLISLITYKIIEKNIQIVFNLNLNVHCNSESPNVFKSIFKQLICYSNINIKNDQPEINIIINPQNLMLSKSLIENVIKGNFKNYSLINKKFKSKIIFKNKVYETKIRFHGTNPSNQHIKGNFFSMNVDILNGENINGLTSFDLILKDRLNPRSLFLPIVSRDRIIVRDLELFKVKLNSSEWQYFYMQPNRNENFFYNFNLNIFLPNRTANKYSTKRGFVFEKDYIFLDGNNTIFNKIENIKQRNSIASKYNKLNNYLIKNTKINNLNSYFDLKYLSNFLSIYLLLGCDLHGNTDGNLLVGYNTDNGKFYPIIHRDYNSRYLNDNNFKDCYQSKLFLNRFFDNPLIRNQVINSLKTIDEDFIQFNQKYETELKKFYLTTLIGSYVFNFHKEIFFNDLNVFKKNMNFLKKNFFPLIKNIELTKNNSDFTENFKNNINQNKLNLKFDKDQLKIFISGKNFIKKNINFPKNYSVIIEEGTSIIFNKNAYLKFYNNLYMMGSDKKPIKVLGNNKGTIILSDMYSKNNNLIIKDAYFENMKEAIDDGVRYTGGITILSNSTAKIINSNFKNFLSEDVINFKGFGDLVVNLSKNNFIEINNDGIDSDFVKKITINENIIRGSIDTLNENSDGLDFSKTEFDVYDNLISNFLDKCISVGESSRGAIKSNTINNCNFGIANKDGSVTNLGNNNFKNNTKNISSYIKKKSYKKPLEIYD